MAQRVLKGNEVLAETPRSVFRELDRLGWIDNVEEWIEFQKSRNHTSHECGEKLAKHSYGMAQKFLPLAVMLFDILKGKANVSPKGLSPKHLDQIKKILNSALRNKTNGSIFVFGSRAKGNFRKYSGLDLWVEVKPQISSEELSDLADALPNLICQ